MQGKVKTRVLVKRGQNKKICGTERGTLHVGNRGKLEECDMMVV